MRPFEKFKRSKYYEKKNPPTQISVLSKWYFWIEKQNEWRDYEAVCMLVTIWYSVITDY